MSTSDIDTSCFTPYFPAPTKTSCSACGNDAPEGVQYKRCAKCHHTAYCSKECQAADWPKHKQICKFMLADNGLNYGALNFGEKQRKNKKGPPNRTRGEVLQDLSKWANIHNGESLTLTAWHALDLLRNIDRRRTHFFAITLRRRPNTTDPRTLYSLIDCEVLPRSLMEEKYHNTGDMLRDERPSSEVGTNPVSIWDTQEVDRKRESARAYGACMVVSMELPEGDNRPVRQAFKELSVQSYQPLGLYQAHIDAFKRLPTNRLPREFWLKCLKNSLDGGAWSVAFHPYRPYNG